MPIEPHRDDSRSDPGRKVPAQRGGGYVSARRAAGAAEVLSLRDRIQVTREGGRICVVLTRKYKRIFFLGDDEADYLRGLLGTVVAPVTVTRIEDRQGGES